MNPPINLRFLPLILTSLFVIGLLIPGCVCQNNQLLYQTCSQPFKCGSLREIRYPFYRGNRPASCGYPGFELDCRGNNEPLINIASIIYRVIAIDNSSQTLTVSRNDLWDSLCPTSLFNTTLNSILFYFYLLANDQNITLYYGCKFTQLPPSLAPNYIFNCSESFPNRLNFFIASEVSRQANGFSSACTSQIYVRVNETAARDLADPTAASAALLQNSLDSGFSIRWSMDNENCDYCVQLGGLCGYVHDLKSFACHCAYSSFRFSCTEPRRTRLTLCHSDCTTVAPSPFDTYPISSKQN